jgi:putative flippase GtrA
VTSPLPETPNAPTFRETALRFARSLIVGSGGTALDFAALTLSLRLFHVDATWARLIGLVAGGVLLFFGSRSFAFRAAAEHPGPQATRFVVSELIGFPLNMLVFKLLLHVLPAVAPELLSLVANFALFLTYYYPVRSYLVFRVPTPRVFVKVAATKTTAPTRARLAAAK